MPSVQAGALMPMGAGPLNTQQGVPDVGPQQPPMAPGQPNAPSQQSSSQLDAYVAAASAAQQYAQYYEVYNMKIMYTSCHYIIQNLLLIHSFIHSLDLISYS